MSFDLTAFITSVASYLPDWKYVVSGDEELGQRYHNLNGQNGARLFISYDDRTKKISVTPCYVRENGVQYPYSYKNDPPLVGTINISVTRSAEAVAKDIQKRVIDGYLPLYEKGVQQLASIKDYEAKKAAIATEFAELLNDDRHRHGNDNVSRYVYKPGCDKSTSQKDTCYIEIQVNSDGVNLKINSLPFDVAKQIIAMFPKLDKDQRTL